MGAIESDGHIAPLTGIRKVQGKPLGPRASFLCSFAISDVSREMISVTSLTPRHPRVQMSGKDWGFAVSRPRFDLRKVTGESGRTEMTFLTNKNGIKFTNLIYVC